MWTGFTSINPDLLLELIKQRISGNLCLFGLVGDDIPAYPQSGNGRVLFDKRLSQVVIGKAVVPWTRLVVLKYKRLRDLADDVVGAAYRRSDQPGFWLVARDHTESLAPARRWFYRILNRFRVNHLGGLLPQNLPWISPYNDLLPSDQQWQWLAADQSKQPMYLVSFLEFRDRAQYPDTPQPVDDIHGKTAYLRYLKKALRYLGACGGTAIWSGKPLAVLSRGDQPEYEDWAEIVIFKYPQASKFMWMLTRQGYQQALVHRLAALQRIRAYSFN